ncbi:MAG: hypothetical protein K6B14_05655 [Lachnospiraceae bacterium]|nr:hypothetical protein [Lachnospiraceae bacterium]
MNNGEREAACKKIRSDNEECLSDFKWDLVDQGLMEKTISRHLNNLDLFLNKFMLGEEAKAMEEGPYLVDDFYKNYFIHKCDWATGGSIKSTSESLKKFYMCMFNNGRIETEDYMELSKTIKDKMPEWQAEYEQTKEGK